MSPRSKADVACVVAGAGLALLGLVWWVKYLHEVWRWTVDDAFIGFRYSQMLARGHGLTFNPGLQHVEGYTDFLWVAILALPEYLRADTVLIAKVLGVVATVLTMALAAFGAWLWSGRDVRSLRFVAAGGAVAVLGTFPATAVHASAGMETALFTALVTGIAIVASRYVAHAGTAGSRALAFLCLLGGLTRPEGNLFAVAALIGAGAMTHQRRKLACDAVLIYVIPGVIYFGARYLYYRHAFPVPYYVKVNSQAGLPGWPYVKLYLERLLPFLLLVPFCFRRSGGALLVPPFLVACSIVAFGVIPAYITGYEWRYVYPVTPLIAASAGAGSARALGFLLRRGPVGFAFAGAAACVLISVGFWHWRQLDPPAIGIAFLQRDAAGPNASREALGEYLADFTTTRARPMTIALQDAGAVPYYSRWRTIDFAGLNDNRIGIAHRFSPSYVLGYRPDIIIIPTYDSSSLQNPDPHTRQLWFAAAKRGMRPVVALKFGSLGYWWLVAKPRTAIASYLARWSSPLAIHLQEGPA